MTVFEIAADRVREHAGERLAQWTRALCVLFFLSGAPALIYQLAWQRVLLRVFGVGVESVAVVAAMFVLGLALGCLAGGWLSKLARVSSLLLLAALEAATGVFGLVSLAIFDQVGAIAFGQSLLLMAAATLALVIVPTLLMGATLPVLAGHLARRSGHVGGSVGLLCYVNTLGAGTACLAGAVLLFPFLGLQGAIYVAVAINGLVAAGALAMHWRDRADSAVMAVAAPIGFVRPAALGLKTVMALAAGAGFVSLSYGVVFFRVVSYASGSSAIALAMTLSAFLVGLASGSYQAGSDCRLCSREEVMRRAARAVLKANLLGLLFLPLVSYLAWLDRGIVGVAILMVFLMARYWGALLPCLADLGIATDTRAGMRIALLCVANLVGAALGLVVTGVVLVERLGLVGIAAALVAIGMVCLVGLVIALDLPRWQKWLRGGLAAAVGVLALFAVPALADRVLENLRWKGTGDGRSFVDMVQNRHGIVTIDHNGSLHSDGIHDGRLSVELKRSADGVAPAYALSLVHPAPRHVLLIGLSTGAWAQVIANNPAVASLTVVEANPGYLELIKRVPEMVSLLTNRKVVIEIDDSRRWLRLHPERKFDAIVANIVWHFRANTANLLSSEFFELVKEHLEPGGAFVYNAAGAERAQRTGCLTFAHGARFMRHMVVSASPIVWDFARWLRVLESYRIDGKLVLDPVRAADEATLNDLMAMDTAFALDAGRRSERPIEACPDVLVRTAGKQPITDDNMGSEWRYFLGLE